MITDLLPNEISNVDLSTAAVDDGSVSHVVRISKNAGRQLADDKLRVQVDAMMGTVNSAQRKLRGWTIQIKPWHAWDRKRTHFDTTNDAISHCDDCNLPRIDHPENWYVREYVHDSATAGHYVYHVAIIVECHPERKRKTIDSEFQNIIASLATAGRRFSGENWLVTLVDGLQYKATAPEDITDADLQAEIGYAPFHLPSNWRTYFTDLYGLDDQIELIIDAIAAAQRSNWQGRYNVALIGPPGCGKSNILQLLKKMLGEESVLEFDGTSTTMAGAQKELAEREELPRILFVEEIEKAPETSLAWLLSIGDSRAEVRKTTARGNLMRDVKMLVVCTVNNVDTFNAAMSGALSSRFPNPIGFMRPSYEIRRRILEREIKRVPGSDMAWIDPAIKFAERIQTDDPRNLIAICMCGREKLLDGSYQRMRLATMVDKTIVRVAPDPDPPAAENYAF